MNALLLMLALTLQPSQLDADGWTVLTPSADSRMIYVSSSAGNDANDGLTPATPKATIEAGLLLLRNQQPDWLMLKCGDTFSTASSWRLDRTGGPAADSKMVITSYGTGARPVLKNGRFWYGSNTKPLTHFAMVGLDFYASYRDPSSPDFQQGTSAPFAVQFLLGDSAATGSDDWLFENNRFRYYVSNVQLYGNQGVAGVQTAVNGITFRRNSVTNAEEFGLQLAYSSNALIEQNVFDRNGWEHRTVQLHNVYVTGASHMTVRNNLFSRGGNMSLKLSGNKQSSMTDFIVEDNVFHRGMVGFGHGVIDGSWDTQTTYSHDRGVVRNNVLTKPGKTLPYNATTTQAIGFNIGNLNDVLFESNIFAHNDEIQSGGQIFFFADPAIERSANITARNNVVWNWLSNQHNATGSYMYNDQYVTNFTQENNLPEDKLYNDPSRTLGSYNATCGGPADDDAFIARATEMQKGDWDTRYTAAEFNKYMRFGFLVVTPEPNPTPDPVPDPEPVPVPTPAIDRLLAGLRAAAAAFLEGSE